MKKFHGIIPALVTPYTKDGAVDHEQLKKLIDKLIDEKVSGFYVTGSTGECFLLSDDERNAVVKTVAEHVNGRAQVIVHVGSMSTDHSIAFAKYAQSVGADAISAVPPFYYKYNIDELTAHYYAIMDSVDLPMIAYNFPALSGIELTTEHISKLNQHRNFAGVKHTNMNLYMMEQFQTVDKELSILCGHDEIYLAGLAMGADGAIGSTFNVMAPKYLEIFNLYQQANMQEAFLLQQEVNQIIGVMIECGIQQSIKYILGKQGIECNGCRRPMHPITDEQKAKLDIVAGLI